MTSMQQIPHYSMILIGVSAGGLHALLKILPCFSESCSLPIIIVQHIQEGDQYELPEILNKHTSLPIQIAHDKDRLRSGIIYIAPPGYHLLLESGDTLALSIDAAVCWARPSVDVLFESAALFASSPVIAVILTGANTDGSNGLKLIKQYGGMTIVQDPETADSPVMPQSAIDHTEVDHIIALDGIGSFLADLAQDNHFMVEQYGTSCTG